MNARRLLAVSAIGTLAVALSACSSSSTSSSAPAASSATSASSAASTSASSTASAAATSSAKKLVIVIGFAPPGYNEATQQWQNGYEAAVKSNPQLSVQFKYTSNITFDPATLDQLINAALVEKPAGIVIDSSAGPATESTLETAIQRGVKVVAVDNPLPGLAGLSSYVGTNNFQAGQMAAQTLTAAYKAHKLQSSTVAILGSTPGSASLDQRTAGFKAGLAGSGLTIVDTLDPTCDIATAQTDAANVLTAHPTLGAFFGNCGQDAQGASQTLIQKHDLKVYDICIDPLSSTVKEMVADQGVNALVAQHLWAMTNTALTTMAKVLGGQQVPISINSGLTLVTPANASSFLTTYTAQLHG